MYRIFYFRDKVEENLELVEIRYVQEVLRELEGCKVYGVVVFIYFLECSFFVGMVIVVK